MARLGMNSPYDLNKVDQYATTQSPLGVGRLSLDMSNVPSATPQQSDPYGGPTGMTPAETQMAGSIATGAGQIASSLLGGYMQGRENEKAAQASVEQADLSREDTIKQQKKENQMRLRTLEQEKKMQRLTKMKQDADLSHSMFLQNFQKAVDARKQLLGVIDKFNGSAVKNADMRNALLSAFGRK